MPINPNDKEYEKAHLRRIAAREKALQALFEDAAVQIAVTFSQITWNGNTFYLKDYPLLLARINQIIARLRPAIYVNVVSGITSAWELANQKNNRFVDKRLAGKTPSAIASQILYDSNLGALRAFITRKEAGLNLSQRVFNTMGNFKVEMETALGVGISEGKSAAAMARDLKRYLKEPDRLFRKVRQNDGTLKLSKAAREYHPGQGIARSSFGNALRVTRNETNLAFRSADVLRYRNLPFVIGYKINLSRNHKIFDICDELNKSIYPKDFNWAGWHVNCLCYLTAVQISDEEYEKYEDAILATGKAPDVPQISQMPEAFNNWVGKNAERIEGWSNKPYWWRDNQKFIKPVLK